MRASKEINCGILQGKTFPQVGELWPGVYAALKRDPMDWPSSHTFAGIAGGMLINTKVLDCAIAGILLVMGLWQLGVLEFGGLSLPLKRGSAGAGYAQAFMLGIPFAISASPCTTPITMGLLAFSASRHSGVLGMSIMAVFALGRSLPLLAVGVFAGFLKTLKAVSKYQPLVEKAAGVLLIGLGLYFFWKA